MMGGAQGSDGRFTAGDRRNRAAKAQAFLIRFIGRGWLYATREDAEEQAAVDYGLQRGWLRRELGEVHFTPAGRKVLDP